MLILAVNSLAVNGLAPNGALPLLRSVKSVLDTPHSVRKCLLPALRALLGLQPLRDPRGPVPRARRAGPDVTESARACSYYPSYCASLSKQYCESSFRFLAGQFGCIRLTVSLRESELLFSFIRFRVFWSQGRTRRACSGPPRSRGPTRRT